MQERFEPDLFVARLLNGKRPRTSAGIRGLLLAVEVLSPSSVRADRIVKRAMYRDEAVDEYWVIDLDARVVERSTPSGPPVEVIAEVLRWHPPGAPVPLDIDLRQYFAEVLDE
jgi:Uma2 family endonuclease